MKQKYLLYGGIAGTVLAAAVIWWLMASGISLIPSRQTGSMGFHWEPECRASYHFRLTTDMQYGIQTRKLPFQMAVSGTLNMRVLTTGDTHSVGFELSPVLVTVDGEADALLQQLFQTPFTVDVQPSGQFGRFHFPDSVAPKDRAMLTGLLQSLEMILPDNKKQLYTLRQEDNLGQYIATYRRKDSAVKKEKKRYLISEHTRNDSFALPFTATVLDSHYSFQPDTDGCWLYSLTGEERVSVLFEHNQYQTTSRSSISLSKIPAPVKHSVLWSGSGPADWHASKRTSSDEKRSVTDRRRDRQLDDALAYSGADLTQLIRRLASKNYENSLLLRRYLTTHPDQIKDIPLLLLNKDLDDFAVAETINSLGIVGIPEAQAALVSIAQNPAFSEENRFRAIVSFSSLTVPPTSQAFQFLTRHLEKIIPGKDNSELVTTPILVSGIIVQNIREAYPEIAATLNKELVSLLETAKNNVQTTYLIQALGNSRDEENGEIIADFIDASNMRVRENAAEALARFDSPQVNSQLISRLNLETQDVVKCRILNSLTDHTLQTDDIRVVQQELLTSESADVRQHAIKLLENHMQLDESSIKVTFKKAFEKETSRTNQKLLIRAYAK